MGVGGAGRSCGAVACARMRVFWQGGGKGCLLCTSDPAPEAHCIQQQPHSSATTHTAPDISKPQDRGIAGCCSA